MSEEKIGGISLDDIMAAAMDGLDEGDTNSAIGGASGETNGDTSKSENNGTPAGGIVMKKCSVCGAESTLHYTQEICPVCNHHLDGRDVVTDPDSGVKSTDSGTSSGATSTGVGIGVNDNSSGLGSGTGGSSVTVGVSTGDSVKSIGRSADSIQDDVYTIGSVRLVNVNNRLSGIYENQVGDIMSYIDAGRTAEAMQMAQDLVDHNMSNEVAWLIYAYAKEAWGDRQLAKKAYEQAIAINPIFALALNDYGSFYLDDEDVDSAMPYFKRALECDPKNELYMSNVAYFMCFTDSYNAAIEKCKYFIDTVEEKTYLQNTLGRIYIALSKEYIVDVPNDFDDPSQGTTPGFISLEDIQEVRRLCNEAKSLITLDKFKDDAEMAETLLQECDEDCELLPTYKKGYVILHSIGTFIIYTLITLVWGAPIGLFAAIMNGKANMFPRYVFNYIWCTGSDDPLKYSHDSFYSNHAVLKSMADGARDTWSNDDAPLETWGQIAGAYLKVQFWFLKARIQFYKRFFKQRKEQKQNSIGVVKTDDIQPQADENNSL